MKLLKIFLGVLVAIAITGCSAEEEKSAPKEKKVVQKKEETVAEAATEPTKTEVTFAEFDKSNKRDPEEKEYIDGVFIMKDGSKTNADYLSYVDGSFYDYAMAIFYEGKLAKIQLETAATIDEVEKGLGVSLKDVTVDATKIGYEIVFDETFADSNIEKFPFELD